jgi:voltage-gated potassium channel
MVLAALALEWLIELDPEILLILFYVDTGFCILFFFDFLISLVRAEDRWRYMVTWGWLDLLSSVPAVPWLRLGRLARIVRIARVLRGLRAARTLASFWIGRRAQTAALVALLLSVVAVVGSSIAVLHLERPVGGDLGSGPAALWWSFFTVTTGEYGDLFPVTPVGRTLGVVLMTVGAAVVGTLTAALVSWFIREEEGEQDRQLHAIRRELAEIRALLETR